MERLRACRALTPIGGDRVRAFSCQAKHCLGFGRPSDYRDSRITLGCTIPLMALAKEDRSEALRNEVEELREEAAAPADRAKRTARQADDSSERIRHLEKALAKRG